MLHKATGRPVNNLGACPHNPEGAERAGLAVSKREKLRKEYAGKSTVDLYRDHKFAIVFEHTFFLKKIFNELVGSFRIFIMWAMTSISYYIHPTNIFKFSLPLFCFI